MTEIIQPGEIRPPSKEAPFVRTADRKRVFGRRAERLIQLAQGHPLEPFLLFMSQVAQAQQNALDRVEPTARPPRFALPEHRRQGIPVFDAMDESLPPVWRDLLGDILTAVEPAAPAPTRTAIAALRAATPYTLDEMARALLSGESAMADPAQAPLLAAALQVHWTHLATTLPAADFGEIRGEREAHPANCPVCGSLPDLSIVRIGGAEQGLRYLHCPLCESEWHLVRVKCANCEATTGISYLGIDGDNGAVKAEACGECNTYLKILYMEKDLEVEPVADDLASLGLDLLMAEEGLLRSGRSLFFIPGEETASAN